MSPARFFFLHLGLWSLWLAGLEAPLAQPDPPSRVPGRIALLRALDKVDGRTETLRVQVGQTVRYGWLDITVHHCESTPPTEQSPESFVFLQIVERMDGSSPRPATTSATTESEPESTPVVPSSAAGGEAAPLAGSSASSEAQFEAQSNTQADPQADPLSSPPPPETEAASHLLFSGWMFASSPALNPLEHSIWDVWVLACLDGPDGPDSETAS